MALSVDAGKIVHAKVVPWEDEYGNVHQTTDGIYGTAPIGTQAKAEALAGQLFAEGGEPLTQITAPRLNG